MRMKIGGFAIVDHRNRIPINVLELRVLIMKTACRTRRSCTASKTHRGMRLHPSWVEAPTGGGRTNLGETQPLDRERVQRVHAREMVRVPGHHGQVMREGRGRDLRVLDPHLSLGISTEFAFEFGGVASPLGSLGLVEGDHTTSEILPKEGEVALELSPPLSFGQPFDSVTQFGQGDRREGALRLVGVDPRNDAGIRLRLDRLAHHVAVQEVLDAVGKSG